MLIQHIGVHGMHVLNHTRNCILLRLIAGVSVRSSDDLRLNYLRRAGDTETRLLDSPSTGVLTTFCLLGGGCRKARLVVCCHLCWIVSHTNVSIDIASYASLLCNVRGDTVLKCMLWYSWLGLLSGVRNDEGNLTEMVCVGRARTEPLV